MFSRNSSSKKPLLGSKDKNQILKCQEIYALSEDAKVSEQSKIPINQWQILLFTESKSFLQFQFSFESFCVSISSLFCKMHEAIVSLNDVITLPHPKKISPNGKSSFKFEQAAK